MGNFKFTHATKPICRLKYESSHRQFVVPTNFFLFLFIETFTNKKQNNIEAQTLRIRVLVLGECEFQVKKKKKKWSCILNMRTSVYNCILSVQTLLIEVAD